MRQIKISVHRPICVNLDADRKITLPAGVHTVDAEVAEHWYVKANSEPLSDGLVGAGELEAAQQQIAELTAKVAELEQQNSLLSIENAELTAKVAELQSAAQPPATDKKGK